MTEEKELELLKAAEHIAQKTGDYFRQGLAESREKVYLIDYEDDEDEEEEKVIVLQGELESERFIYKNLIDYTGLSVIGAVEGGDPGLFGSGEYFWVVDALDSIDNYLRGQPACINIGLMQGGEYIGGVVYDFNQDEMYSGSQSTGLRINNESITPNWAEDIEQACLMTGYPTNEEYPEDSLDNFREQVQRFNKVRMIGSVGLSLAAVASGRADAYAENKIWLWDMAAGGALVLAVGGCLKITPTAEPFLIDVWAVSRKEWFPKPKR